MFKTEAIILNVHKIRDSQVRIILFTREYGRVSCWFRKREFPCDIGDVILVFIERKGGENIIKNIETQQSIVFGIWEYCTIIPFLEILRIFHALLPESVPHIGIFEDYTGFLKILKSGTAISLFHYVLFQFRILKVLGFVDRSDFTGNARMSYIHDNIHVVSIRRLLESKPLHESEGELLQKINLEILYRLA